MLITELKEQAVQAVAELALKDLVVLHKQLLELQILVVVVGVVLIQLLILVVLVVQVSLF